MKTSAPNGVDCFFDNVGGDDASAVIRAMNNFGRVSCCGAISGYNDKEWPKVDPLQWILVSKQIRMEGFLVTRWAEDPKVFNNGLDQMVQWIKDGKIKVKETKFDGFEKTPEAFIGMLMGKNQGKMVVKC